MLACLGLGALGVSTEARAGQYPYTNETSLDATDVSSQAAPHLADLDGDGDLDVMLVGYDSLWWYENVDGLQTDMQERRIDPALMGVDRAVVRDMDADGDLDVIATGRGVRWYENVENAAAFTVHSIDAEDIEGEVDVGDVDGDGDQDVLLADYYSEELHWYTNPGAGVDDWGAAKVIPSSQYGTDAILVADVDGDGRSELLAAENDGELFELFRYEDGPWSSAPLDIGSGVVEMRAADLDADGDLDVLCGQERHAIVMRNLGDGVFGYEQLADNGNVIIEFRLGLGDVDVDGDDDIVAVTHNGSNAIHWYPNDGGTYGAAQTIVNEFYNSWGMDVADADCDGDADIVAHGDTFGWTVLMLTNETANGGACSGGTDDTGGTDGGTDDGDPDDGGTAADETGGADDAPADVDDGGEVDDGGDDATSGAMQDDDEGGGGLCSIDRRAPIGTLALFGLLAIVARRRCA